MIVADYDDGVGKPGPDPDTVQQDPRLGGWPSAPGVAAERLAGQERDADSGQFK